MASTPGLKRRGFSADEITQIRQAYKTLYKSNLTLAQAKLALADMVTEAPEGTSLSVQLILTFLGSVTRGIVR
jgi:UDP-N-acetylglucosamine acyltransferase